ncbi:FAD-dependent thymidylate synthase [Nocardia beijingensis]
MAALDTDTDVTTRSDVEVELVKSQASDADVLFAARVSTQGPESLAAVEADATGSSGLINFLMKNRHGSPFEHNSFTFYIHAPIFVFRELMRHRIASYNEESGRYRQLRPVFYKPSISRNIVQVGKAGAYTFEPGTTDQYEVLDEQVDAAYEACYRSYTAMLEAGIAREVARIVLPVGLFSSAYMTVNARSLMNVLSLRTKSPDSAYPSFPQAEIEMVAEQMEKKFAELMPLTHAAFVKNGRVAP